MMHGKMICVAMLVCLAAQGCNAASLSDVQNEVGSILKWIEDSLHKDSPAVPVKPVAQVPLVPLNDPAGDGAAPGAAGDTKPADVSASVECSPNGFKPSFTKTAESEEGNELEIDLGSCTKIKPIPTSSGSSVSMASADFVKTGDEIPFGTCGGSLANDAEKNPTKIEFSVKAKIVVRHKISNIAREKYYQVEITCSLTKQQAVGTASEKWVVDTGKAVFQPLDAAEKEILFPMDINFYTDATRATAQQEGFTAVMGEKLFIRIKETKDNSLFHSVTSTCYFTTDKAGQTDKNVFFKDGCMLDKDPDNNDFVDKVESSPNFDMTVKSFYFPNNPTSKVYLHCDEYICMNSDTDPKCKQKTHADCAKPKGKPKDEVRKRRSASNGPVEVVQVSSPGFQVIPAETN